MAYFFLTGMSVISRPRRGRDVLQNMLQNEVVAEANVVDYIYLQQRTDPYSECDVIELQTAESPSGLRGAKTRLKALQPCSPTAHW